MSACFTAPAHLQDCPTAASLLAQHLSDHGISSPIPTLVRLLQQVVTHQDLGFVHLARTGTDIVGIAYLARILSAEYAGPVGWLEELYVAPSHRNQGIGTTLLAAVIDRARSTDLVAIDLEIPNQPPRAASLYQRSGFHPLPRSRWTLPLHPRP